MSEFRTVARASEIEPGKIVPASIDDVNIIIANVDGEFFALDDICSHDDGPLGEGTVEGFEVVCPRHEGRFDVRTGKATCFPAVWPIECYDVRVVDDEIQVAI